MVSGWQRKWMAEGGAPTVSVSVHENTAWMDAGDEASLRRYLEYTLTGWVLRTGRKGAWSVMVYVSVQR